MDKRGCAFAAQATLTMTQPAPAPGAPVPPELAMLGWSMEPSSPTAQTLAVTLGVMEPGSWAVPVTVRPCVY